MQMDDSYPLNISSMKSISRASSTVSPSPPRIANSAAVKLAVHFFRKLNKKGVIVMISSTAGYMGEPIPGYSAAKHGV